MANFIKQKVVNPLLNFLKQGTSPHKLAISIAIGFVLGLFPVLGVTTFIGFGLAFVFKLNAAAIQLVNYLLYPIQIALIIPLIKIGSWLFGTGPINYTITQLLDFIAQDFYGALVELSEIYVLGVFAWGALVLPLGLPTFIISKALLVRTKAAISRKREVIADQADH